MPRNLDPAFAAALTNKVVCPAIFVDLAINNQTLHVWTGVGTFTWNGNTYTGVGELGQVSPAQEGTTVQANGASLMLSGVDPIYVQDALSDLQLGGAATIGLALLDTVTFSIIGQPTVIFAGLMDAPTIDTGVPGPDGEPGKATITVPLESRLAMLGSGQQRKFSRADQNLTHPDDTAFLYVSLLNYLAIKWNP